MITKADSKKTIFITTIAVILLLLKPIEAETDLNFNVFFGASGPGIFLFALDVLTEANGEIVESAGEYGLITGELGLGFDLAFKYVGFRTDVLFGTYKYSVFELPNTTYAMLMVGGEPYIKLEPVVFGGGFGYFWGYNWQEAIGTRIGPYTGLKGYSIWGMIGVQFQDFIEINGRLRWHRFTKFYTDEKDIDEELKSDVVFILRISLILNII